MSVRMLTARPSVVRLALPIGSRLKSSSPPSEYAFKLRSSFRTYTTGLVASAALLYGYAYYTDSRAAVHTGVIMPLARALTDAEQSHWLAVQLLRLPFGRPVDRGVDAEGLTTELFGHKVSNPVGLAAGFDKHAEAIDGLFDLGFGYVEIGSVTPLPQPGNPKPRMFRLVEDQSVINRYGFNSLGHATALSHIQDRVDSFYRTHPSMFPPSCFPKGPASSPLPPPGLPRSLIPGRLLGINLGKNKVSAADSDEDYKLGVRTFGPYADVLVINVSSPNTPGLRKLQGGDRLGQLLTTVVKERDSLVTHDGVRPKVVVKIAPDLGTEEIDDVARAIKQSKVDGVIVSNTTISRPDYLQSANKKEIGGLSGPPVKPLALKVVRALRARLPVETPIIGCGGISSGSDALEFARAGASAVQMYTSFGYAGVGLPRKIKDELEETFTKEGTSWASAVKEGKQSGRL
ncbi:dihydroorotate dehydrogenase [Phaffia rhodozyma]|uniref:Dihydroorotate dehydrogenase (quinone), mitochondrial n=1 Tax=Phaffia rhodozyma TaxID=264483 RepID=A0A0F7SIS7_PHARH|nr:dihydroorotate dehydrogenase [Phaffia rhodozyma]